MRTILEWIKANIKDGANVAEAEELISRDSISGIKTKEQAAEVMSNNAAFTSAMDSAISKAVVSHDEKFNAEKLPGLIEAEREKIRAELNPKETEEQKRIRELEKKLDEQAKKEQISNLEKELVSKASDLGYDPKRASRLVVYGENALTYLEEEAEAWNASINEKVGSQLKDKFSQDPPAANQQNNISTEDAVARARRISLGM